MKRILQALENCQQGGYDQALAMPPEFYTSAEFLAVELEQLFHKQWNCVGRQEEIPQAGDYFTFNLIGEPLLLIRDDAGQTRAFANTCRHRGMPLLQGSGQAKRLVCPYHAWSYNTSGKLLNTPFIKRAECQELYLHEFRCEIWHGFIYVNLDANAPALAPQLQGLEPLLENYCIQDMTVRFTKEAIWPVNWKCLAENFMEGYHLSKVHRDTIHPYTPTRLCEHFTPGLTYSGYFANFPPETEQRGVYPPNLTAQERLRSVMFSVMPAHVAGTAGHLMTYLCLQPLAVDCVKAKLGVAVYDSQITADELDQVVTLFERTMAEDEVQMANLQRGLSSRYCQPSVLAPKDYEGTVWDFYQYIGRKVLTQKILAQTESDNYAA